MHIISQKYMKIVLKPKSLFLKKKDKNGNKFRLEDRKVFIKEVTFNLRFKQGKILAN